jgi:hypothetical protein
MLQSSFFYIPHAVGCQCLYTIIELKFQLATAEDQTTAFQASRSPHRCSHTIPPVNTGFSKWQQLHTMHNLPPARIFHNCACAPGPHTSSPDKRLLRLPEEKNPSPNLPMLLSPRNGCRLVAPARERILKLICRPSSRRPRR